MKLNHLKSLLESKSPLTTICVDVSHAEGSEAGDISSRWRILRRELEEKGADQESLDLIESKLLSQVHLGGSHGRYIAATKREIICDYLVAKPPTKDQANFEKDPLILPAVRASDDTVRYLLVQVDHQGANLLLSGSDSHNPGGILAHIEGNHDVLHKVNGGGWSHRRFQSRVEDSLERNAEVVAKEVDRITSECTPELILISGDVRSVALVLKSLGHAAKKLVVEVPGGPRAEGVNEDVFAHHIHQALELFREKRRNVTLERVKEALGRGVGAVTGLSHLVEVLRKGQVKELVFTEGTNLSSRNDNEPKLWVGPGALDIAEHAWELEDLGLSKDQLREVSVQEAVLKAALTQDAEFTFLDGQSVVLDDNMGALLRWEDASTPKEGIAALNRHN